MATPTSCFLHHMLRTQRICAVASVRETETQNHDSSMRRRSDSTISSMKSGRFSNDLPGVAEDGMFQEVSGGRPVGGLELKTSQCDVPQAWRQMRWDTRCCGSTGNLERRDHQRVHINTTRTRVQVKISARLTEILFLTIFLIAEEDYMFVLFI